MGWKNLDWGNKFQQDKDSEHMTHLDSNSPQCKSKQLSYWGSNFPKGMGMPPAYFEDSNSQVHRKCTSAHYHMCQQDTLPDNRDSLDS